MTAIRSMRAGRHLLTLVLLSGAAPALAQTAPTFSCDTGRMDDSPQLTAGHHPLPRIVRWGVSSASDPAASVAREPREASVVGGDAAHGWLRIDLAFDAAVPSGCRLPLILTVAADQGLPSDRAVASQQARVFDGMTASAGRIDVMDHLQQAMTVTGRGTDTVTWQVPIRVTEGAAPGRHAMKLVTGRDYAGGLPFTLAVQPLPAPVLVPPGGELRHGAPAVIRADAPQRLLPGAAALPVSFRLSASALGSWQQSGSTPPADPAATLGGWDNRFATPRAEAVLLPGDVAQPTPGTITVSWAGRSQVLPITVNPAVVCDPAFTLAAVPGGLRLTMSNRNRGTCPAHVATPLMPAKAVLQLSPARATLTGPAAGSTTGGLRPGAPVARLPVRPGPLPMLAGTRGDGGALFTISRLAFTQLTIGSRFEIEVQPDTPGEQPPRRRIAITLSAADIAAITATPPTIP